MKRQTGFTLVEVTLALGLLSFMLLAVIGLTGVGLSTSRSAQEQTAMGLVIRSLQAGIRSNTPGGYPGETNYFRLDGSTNSGPAGAYFQAVIQPNLPVSTFSSADFAGVRIEITYPVDAPTARRTTNTFHASLVREN